MADWTGEGVDTAARWREMATKGYADRSPRYRRLALAMVDDPDLLSRLRALTPTEQQPNLVFGAVRWLGGPTGETGEFLTWCREHWPEVVAVVRTHRTQTNEARRCTALLPVLATLPGPLALLEVGASAGLCLQPDRYAYRYLTAGGVVQVGDGPVTLTCEVTGDPPLPDRLPEVVWRRGLDLHPLDVTDDDDVRWLQALVWPEQTDRFGVLTTALAIARDDPPVVVEGDLLTDLAPLVRDAPAGATVVVMHSAVLAYLDRADRRRFVEGIHGLGRDVVWVSNEVAGAVVDVDATGHPNRFLLARDGVPLAWTGPHGHTLEWV